MTEITFQQARTIIDGVIAYSRDKGIKPLAAAVLDAGGNLRAYAMMDGMSILRPQIAQGKAYAALAMGMNSRKIEVMAKDRPHFIGAVAGLAPGGMVPVAGGVLVRDAAGKVVGAVGVTGDTSDNDEAAAFAAIEAAGLTADKG